MYKSDTDTELLGVNMGPPCGCCGDVTFEQFVLQNCQAELKEYQYMCVKCDSIGIKNEDGTIKWKTVK